MIRALAHIIALGNMVGRVSPLTVAMEVTEATGSGHTISSRMDALPAGGSAP